jgi:predicted Zn-dependent peptidase
VANLDNFSVQKISNGLTLVQQPMPQVPSVAILVMAGVGSRYESVNQRGISHFLEHLFFKGTVNRPTSLHISAEIDAIGGEFNAFTGKEYTGFYIKAASANLPVCIDLLGDILQHATFDADELERERGVILEEMNMYQDTPSDRVNELYEQLLFGNGPLGWEVIGIPETVKALSRQNIVDYAHDWYAPNNLIVGLAGNYDPTQAQELIAQAFGQATPSTLGDYTPVSIIQSAPQLKVVHKETDQAHLVLGVPAYSLTDPRRYALALLSTILGGNMSSRLFTEVREKRGLAYAVHAYSEEYRDAGSLQCQLGLDPTKLVETIRVVLDELVKIRDIVVGDDELLRAKSYLRGRLALSLEDPLSRIHFALKQQLLEQHIYLPHEITNHLDTISADDIQAVAQDLFTTKHLNAAVIGPVEESAAMHQALTL